MTEHNQDTSYLTSEQSEAAHARIMEEEVERYKRKLQEQNPKATSEQIEDFALRLAPVMHELGLIFGDYKFTGTSRRDYLKLDETAERAAPWELESSRLE